MFFSLAKILWFIVQPLNLAILVGLAGALAAARGRSRAGGTAVFLALAFLALCSWTNVGAMMLQPLEQRYVGTELPSRVSGIILLGGAFEGVVNRARGGHELNAAGDRVVEVAALARRYPDARIVVSGGRGSLVTDEATDAESAPGLLQALGVDAARIVTEGRSRDTYENAIFSRDLLNPAPDQTWLLVTSAFHMPRSVGLFEKAGFRVAPWPVDFRTTGKEDFAVWRDNSVDSLQTATIAIREWIGLAAYRLSGRTDKFLP